MNGQIVKNPDQRVDLERDRIRGGVGAGKVTGRAAAEDAKRSQLGQKRKASLKRWSERTRDLENVLSVPINAINGTEGRNRQVRRMVEAVESKVLKLVRTAIGDIRIGDLPIGRWRKLTAEEVRGLGVI